jgi:uncharacterized protein
MKFRLRPRENRFYPLFTDAGTNLVEAAGVLLDLLTSAADGRLEAASRLRNVEHRGDDVTHEILRQVNATFVTPFDREDIYRLASRVDDVVDYLDAAGDLIVLYTLEELPSEFRVMAETLCTAATASAQALSRLRDPRSLQDYFVEANRLENQADEIYRTFLAKLFSGGDDTLTVLKLKEVADQLENAADAFEHVADMIETIAVKES